MKINLRIPGPVPCPPEVLEAMSLPMINHRGPEFKDLLNSVTERLKSVFITTNDLYVLTASGTGALEASITNTLSPGDKVLATVAGSFGQRYAALAETYGAEVIKVEVEGGNAVDPELVQTALREEPGIKAVLVTHNETSTGVTNDLEGISSVVKGEFGKLLLVDAISSLGCLPLPVDMLGCDVVCTASQKGILVPPGLSFISFGPEAWAANKEARMPRYYFDMEAARRYFEIGQTPYTPAVSLFYALDVALDILLERGLEAIFSHHAMIGEMTRNGIKSLGLSLLSNEYHASNAVTAVRVPEAIEGGSLVEKLRVNHGVVIAGGQGNLEGKIFRIGHLGDVATSEIDEVLKALRTTLADLGFYSPRH